MPELDRILSPVKLRGHTEGKEINMELFSQ